MGMTSLHDCNPNEVADWREYVRGWRPPKGRGLTNALDFLEDNDWLTDQHIYELQTFILGCAHGDLCEYAYYTLERFWHVLLYDVQEYGFGGSELQPDECERMKEYYMEFGKRSTWDEPNDIMRRFWQSRDPVQHCDWAVAMLRLHVSHDELASYTISMFAKYMTTTFELDDKVETMMREFCLHCADKAFVQETLDKADDWIINALEWNPNGQKGKFGCVNLLRMLCICVLDENATGIGNMIWRQAASLKYNRGHGWDAPKAWDWREVGVEGLRCFREIKNPFRGC